MNKISHFLTIILSSVAFNASMAQNPEKSTTPVIVFVAKNQQFSDNVEALGTLRARESVELTSSVTEVIAKIDFKDNQSVKKGDILVEMDTAEEQAELAEQQSFSREAQRQVNRLVPLVKSKTASPSLLDENRRELETAKARMNAIQSRIDQRIIRAPFDGVLGLRDISVGALVQPGSRIITIDDVDVMMLDFSVPEVYLASLKPGLIIEAKTAAYPDRVFKGEIAHVDSRIDPNTRSIQARALIPNDQSLLKPGLLMTVDLQKDPRRTLLIPEEALISNGVNKFVYVVEEKQGKLLTNLRKVTLGARQYGQAEVIEGLSEGENVVTHGTLRVSDGSEVSITAVETGVESLSELLQSASQSTISKNQGMN